MLPHEHAFRRMQRSASISIADQGISSFGNIALTLLVAHVLDGNTFGRYALIIAVAQIVIASGQAIAGEPLLVMRTTGSRKASQANTATGTAIAIGCVCGAPLAVAGFLIGEPAAAVMGLALPGLVLQDSLRFIAFRDRRPWIALVSDSLWTSAQLGAMFVAIRLGSTSLAVLTAIWAVPAWLAAAWSARVLCVYPTMRAIPLWISDSRGLSSRYLGEALSTIGVFQFLIVLTGWFAGVSAAGQLRLVQTIFGPVHVAVTAARSFGLPEMSSRASSGQSLGGLATSLSTIAVFLCLCWTSLLFLLPTHVGTSLVGALWHTVNGFVPLAAGQKLAECVGVGAFLANRALLRAKYSLKVRLLTGLVALASSALLLPSIGVAGALLGLFTSSCLAAILWWIPVGLMRRDSGEPTPFRVSVVSHAYLEPEIAKNLSHLKMFGDVQLIAPRHSKVLVFDNARASDLEHLDFSVSALRTIPIGSSFLLMGLVGALRRGRPDVINIEYDPWLPVFWQTCFAKMITCPRAHIVISVKKNTFRSTPKRLAVTKKVMARAGRPIIHRVMATSEAAASLYVTKLGYDPGRTIVVPHLGVDHELFSAGTDETIGHVVGFVGRISHRKGINVLLSAFEVVSRVHPAARLKLMGPIGADVCLQNQSDIPPWLELVPSVRNSDVASFLREIDVFVMPALKESDHEEHDGRALLEAMMAGRPCIGTDSGVIPELLADGRGIVVPSGEPFQLASAILRALEDQEWRIAASAMSSRYAKEEAALEVVARRKANIFAACAPRLEVDT